MRILIVDDSRAVHAFIKASLADQGFAFDDAFDGAEGVAKAQSADPYDLILLDWEMPVMTGIDAVAHLRAAGVTSRVMMLTSKNDADDVVAALSRGADEYVMKPFTREILIEKIDMLGLNREVA